MNLSLKKDEIMTIAFLISGQEVVPVMHYQVINILKKIYSILNKRTDKNTIRIYTDMFKMLNGVKDLTTYKKGARKR